LKKILILFAHPALQKSRINKVLIDGLDNLENVTFHDLYQSYPELEIDIPHEKELLEKHDIIVLHHPFFWYSTPAILKEWQDLVLEHGWAYGSRGNALKDKICFNVITTGGRREAYDPKGHNNFTIRQLLAPIEQTANLCKMIYLPPYVVHGTHSITPESVRQHREELHDILQDLQQENLNFNDIRSYNYFNDFYQNFQKEKQKP
jgi:glutathione-regulated potassium-efflux system ancillary protein KefG